MNMILLLFICWLFWIGALEIELIAEGARLRVGTLVFWYSTDPHCAGWFNNVIRTCMDSCTLHQLPTYHYVKLGDFIW